MRRMPKARPNAGYRIAPFDLRLFAAVLEHGSITAAADAVNLSLAAASSRLKSLEARVGVRLLDRSKAGAVPTPAGRALARHAHGVLAELESLHAGMAAFAHGLRGSIRVVCNTAAMAEPLPPRLARFLVDEPDIDVELREMPSDAAVDTLRRGLADIAIVADYVDTSGLHARPWIDDELVALVPAGAPPRRARVAFAELLDRPFVGLAPDSGLSRHLLREAGRLGRVPHHRVRVGSFDAIGQIVAAGVGVAIVPRVIASRWKGVRIVALTDAWARRRLLVCHDASVRELPGARALIETLYAQ